MASMQQIGILAKTFVRPSLEENAQAIVAHGFHIVQYNLACAGLDSLPEHIEPDVAEAIRQALVARGITVVALSGTFNMIHPDRQKRQEGLRRLRELALHAPTIGTSLITLCTGTRDPEDMWHGHAENILPEAWKEMRESMETALKIAEDAGVTLAIEPEIANVVDSARKARRLLDELQSSQLKVIIDPANLFYTCNQQRMHTILDEAFDLLGADIVLAHAKDVVFRGDMVIHCPAGTGVLDYNYYLAHLRMLDVPLIMHGLDESEVPTARIFLQTILEESECQSCPFMERQYA